MSEMETGSITVVWKVDKLSEFFGRENEPKEDEPRLSPTFDSKRWRLKFKGEYKSSALHVCVTLCTKATTEETKKEHWERPNCRYTLQILDLRRNELWSTSERIGKCFSKDNTAWSHRGPTRQKLYYSDNAVRDDDALLVCCTLSTPPYLHTPPLPPPPPPRPLFSDKLATAYKAFFEDKQASDVQFLVGNERQAPRKLYANKAFLIKRSEYFRSMFSSDFSEGASADDVDDDPPSKRRKLDRSEEPSPPPEMGAAATEWQDDDDSLEWLPQDWVEEHGPSTVKEEPVEEGDKVEGVVRVTDTGYTTYRAMLYFLYTERVAFTPPASNFAVALAAETTNGQSRRDYLLEQSDPHVGDVEPASAHAVYRLADKLGLDELKDEAKSAILAGFSAENILYEYLSSFAYQFDEIQTAALDFALKNWNDVKTTVAFDRAIDGTDMEGIEGAKELWKKLLKSTKG